MSFFRPGAFFLCLMMAPYFAGAAGLSIPDELIVFDRLEDHMFREDGQPLHPLQKEIIEVFRAARPEIEKMILVKNSLVTLLESFARNNPGGDGNLAKKYADIIRHQVTAPAYQSSDHVNFVYEVFSGPDHDRYQVQGVEQDRLAVNTGRDIFVNVRGLLERKLDVPSMVQLQLHEISHLDRDTPLEVRDAWGARITSWIKSKTQSIDVGEGKVTAILLPKPAAPQSFGTDAFSGDTNANKALGAFVRENYPVIYETKNGARLLGEFYENIATFDGRIGDNPSIPQFQERVPWPNVRVVSLKKSALGLLQVEYEQSSAGDYSPDPRRTGEYTRVAVPSLYGPEIRTARYRVEIDLMTGMTNTQRTYANSLREGDFEINRTQDFKGIRSVSLRMTLPQGMTGLKGPIYVIGKSLPEQKLLSFVVKKSRFLKPGEMLLHLEVPNSRFEINQVVIPKVSPEGFYSEEIVRPSRPVALEGAEFFTDARLAVRSFTVPQKAKQSDKMFGTLLVHSEKKIVGLTLDIEHMLRADGHSFYAIPARTESLAFVGEGRKYFFSEKELAISKKESNWIAKFAFPEEIMRQVVNGPVIRRKFSFYYTEETQTKLQTLTDILQRKINGAWIHFADGTVEKIPQEKLPATVTIMSVEEQSRIEKAAQERARKYLDMFDGPSAARCNQVFL